MRTQIDRRENWGKRTFCRPRLKW